MSETIEGGCLCGALRYTATSDPVFGGHCYCVDCRRDSGTGHGSHMGMPKAAVTITGEEKSFTVTADSGNEVTRHFCPTCGSSVYSTNSGMPELIVLRASSLDDPEQFKPQIAVYASRAPSWDMPDSNLPNFPETPPNVQEFLES